MLPNTSNRQGTYCPDGGDLVLAVCCVIYPVLIHPHCEASEPITRSTANVNTTTGKTSEDIASLDFFN